MDNFKRQGEFLNVEILFWGRCGIPEIKDLGDNVACLNTAGSKLSPLI